MNEDRVVGAARNFAGKAQEGVGRTFGDSKTKAEGVLTQAAGSAQELYGQTKNAVSDAAEIVTSQRYVCG